MITPKEIGKGKVPRKLKKKTFPRKKGKIITGNYRSFNFCNRHNAALFASAISIGWFMFVFYQLKSSRNFFGTPHVIGLI